MNARLSVAWVMRKHASYNETRYSMIGGSEVQFHEGISPLSQKKGERWSNGMPGDTRRSGAADPLLLALLLALLPLCASTCPAGSFMAEDSMDSEEVSIGESSTSETPPSGYDPRCTRRQAWQWCVSGMRMRLRPVQALPSEKVTLLAAGCAPQQQLGAWEAGPIACAARFAAAQRQARRRQQRRHSRQ